jgi:hypothetical protein
VDDTDTDAGYAQQHLGVFGSQRAAGRARGFPVDADVQIFLDATAAA